MILSVGHAATRTRTTTPGSTRAYGSLLAGARRVAAAVVLGGVVDAVITPPRQDGAGWGQSPARRRPTSVTGVERCRYLPIGRLGGVGDGALTGGDGLQHVLQDVAGLHVRPVWRVGDEPGLLGSLAGRLVGLTGRLVDVQQRGGVGDRELGKRGLALRVRVDLDPLSTEAGLRRLGGHRDVGPTEERRRWLAGRCPGQREGRQLVLQRRVTGLGVDDRA